MRRFRPGLASSIASHSACSQTALIPFVFLPVIRYTTHVSICSDIVSSFRSGSKATLHCTRNPKPRDEVLRFPGMLPKVPRGSEYLTPGLGLGLGLDILNTRAILRRSLSRYFAQGPNRPKGKDSPWFIIVG